MAKCATKGTKSKAVKKPVRKTTKPTADKNAAKAKSPKAKNPSGMKLGSKKAPKMSMDNSDMPM